MKKIVLFAMACMAMGLWGSLKAQDCNEIVRPYFLINQIDSNEYPEGKFEWRCHYSRNAFYMVDKIPENAIVYNFTELTNLVTKQHPSADFVVDLNHLSYWEYDFQDFQCKHYDYTIYFRLQNGPRKYLAVRTRIEMADRTDNPEHYKQ